MPFFDLFNVGRFGGSYMDPYAGFSYQDPTASYHSPYTQISDEEIQKRAEEERKKAIWRSIQQGFMSGGWDTNAQLQIAGLDKADKAAAEEEQKWRLINENNRRIDMENKRFLQEQYNQREQAKNNWLSRKRTEQEFQQNQTQINDLEKTRAAIRDDVPMMLKMLEDQGKAYVESATNPEVKSARARALSITMVNARRLGHDSLQSPAMFESFGKTFDANLKMFGMDAAALEDSYSKLKSNAILSGRTPEEEQAFTKEKERAALNSVYANTEQSKAYTERALRDPLGGMTIGQLATRVGAVAAPISKGVQDVLGNLKGNRLGPDGIKAANALALYGINIPVIDLPEGGKGLDPNSIAALRDPELQNHIQEIAGKIVDQQIQAGRAAYSPAGSTSDATAGPATVIGQDPKITQAQDAENFVKIEAKINSKTDPKEREELRKEIEKARSMKKADGSRLYTEATILNSIR